MRWFLALVLQTVAVSAFAFPPLEGGPAPVAAQPRAESPFADSPIVPIGASDSRGPMSAPVTIVEFAEFQCPYSARVQHTLSQLREEYGDRIRLVFKHNPLAFHKKAPLAAQAALAAGEQGKFWQMHDVLFANVQALERRDLMGYARQLGLEETRFRRALDRMSKVLAADQALAAKVGARGTPSFLINGVRLAGAQPIERFREIIDAELAAVRDTNLSNSAAYAERVRKNYKAFVPKAKQAADTKTVYKIPLGDLRNARGGKAPLVTIVEFADLQCPFCQRADATMTRIMTHYGADVRLVVRHNPLSFHKTAEPAARAALAAGQQGKFWPMHALLFKNQKAQTRSDLLRYARQLGLKMNRFERDFDGQKLTEQIKADQALAQRFGARGTPTFFINGRQLKGAQPWDAFERIIDDEIGKARALIKTGVPRAKLYARLTQDGLDKATPGANQRPESMAVHRIPAGDVSNARGGTEALVTIIEFGDLQCPYCKRVQPTLDDIMKTYGDDIRLIFRHNPLSFHRDAPLAARAVLAAGRQGKFWPMHAIIYENQKALKRSDLTQYARSVGLDLDEFERALDDPALQAEVQADKALAARFGATGTPSFFINGRKLSGAQPVGRFKSIIDEEIGKARALIKAGTPRRALYVRMTRDGLSKAAR